MTLIDALSILFQLISIGAQVLTSLGVLAIAYFAYKVYKAG